LGYQVLQPDRIALAHGVHKKMENGYTQLSLVILFYATKFLHNILHVRDYISCIFREQVKFLVNPMSTDTSPRYLFTYLQQ